MTNPFAGPLPTPRQAGRPGPVLTGAWRASVERVDPLAVSIPAFTGESNTTPGLVEIIAGLAVAVGDRVWVVTVDGSSTQWLIIAVRD